MDGGSIRSSMAPCGLFDHRYSARATAGDRLLEFSAAAETAGPATAPRTSSQQAVFRSVTAVSYRRK
jgi:hypothetical protein